MKLIIDIPEEAYNDIQSRNWKNGELIFSEEWKAIHNGTPIPDNANILTVTEWADRCRECGKGFIKIPDNATNGDMFLIEHPDVVASVIKKKGNLFDVIQLRHKGDTLPFAEIYADWWNAPYQKGGKE